LTTEKSNRKEKLTWVYVEVETIMKKDTTTGYLYGKIKKSVVDNLDITNLNEIFKISEIRYFNDDDKFQLYTDKDELGVLFYKIKSIKKLSIYTRDPIYSFDKEELHESTLKIITK
tara:strand:- start:137 stop:484 length:348 start_codon:yes stop_codon:yes gene_type:complete